MSKKLNYENDEKDLISNFEIFGIIILFSFVLFILFPGERILDYALNEKNNTELSELYLKNIYEKYPRKLDIFFILVELYIKNNKINEAKKLLSNISFKDENINFKIQLLNIKLKMMEENENFIEDIYNFFITNARKFSINETKIIYEFNQKLFELKRKEQACYFMIEFFNNNDKKDVRKEIVIEYIRFLKRNELISKCYLNIKKFEDLAMNDDYLAYEIIKLYLEANKPILASDFAYKIMKKKGII